MDRSCPEPPDPSTKQGGFLGPVFATGTLGCYGSPAARYPLTKPGPGQVTATPTVVLIGNTQDPAPSYARAQYVRRAIVRSVPKATSSRTPT
ncbi:MAG: hypothetical protein HYX34_01575 [Actinobacteria bacterium]|nr:hypothetical protein [Actinomycetota bacterium]